MVERTSTAVGQSTTELEMIYENRMSEFRYMVSVRQYSIRGGSAGNSKRRTAAIDVAAARIPGLLGV